MEKHFAFWYFCCRHSELKGLLKCFFIVNFSRLRFMLEDVSTGSMIKPLTQVTFLFSLFLHCFHQGFGIGFLVFIIL